MYEVKDLKSTIKEYQEHHKKEIDNRKNNISNTYILAINDIKVIENYEDSLETYEKIQKILDDLQNRIIQRNRN